MKKIFLFLLCCGVLLTSPVWAQIDSHDLSAGAAAFYAFSDDDFSQGYALRIPYVHHSIEILLSDVMTLSVESGLEFYVSKVEAADEAWNTVNLFSESEMEFTVTDTLSVTPGLAFYFSNYKWDDDRESMIGLDASISGGFSTMEEDLAGISPWEQFQRGLTLNAVFTQELYYKDAGEKVDELDRAVGINAEYAYFNEDAAFMLAPAFSLMKHLNDAMSEALEVSGGVWAAKDLSSVLTGETLVAVSSEKPDPDLDWESELGLGAAINMNLIEKLETSILAEYHKNLSDDDIDPWYGFGIWLEYEIFSQ